MCMHDSREGMKTKTKSNTAGEWVGGGSRGRERGRVIKMEGDERKSDKMGIGAGTR